ncbi:TBPIP-domain-containing protein [Macrolepiota fuliginosa MF-IS2]|uniref:TBPIP-domain-containing protein n=1 Tax=Macrolepiota fuliginosa MF-IS2 TaxID=1400762 RepID=A0A9P5XNB2_9AGAR|nr:TBPIP-domain-containing protein [Macrolepiota fuliginosa MF-IS2]
MNRPFGAVDVAANLKGAVPKATTQKILVALAEKGELTQKTYGKTTFFVINQSKLDCLPVEEIATLETELKAAEEENQALAMELRNASAELTKLKSSPTDAEIDARIAGLTNMVFAKYAKERLIPLREGAPPISSEDLTQVEDEWTRWRGEWVRRRKVFTEYEFWQLATDALAPQDAQELGEDLGLEWDSTEHGDVERGPLCVEKKSLKRKRC